MNGLRIAAYIGPALLGILALSLVPIIYTVYMSFTNRNGLPYKSHMSLASTIGRGNAGCAMEP